MKTTRLFRMLACLLFLNACVIQLPAPPPVPVPPPEAAVAVDIALTLPVAGVHFTLGPTQCDSGNDGTAVCAPVPISVKTLTIGAKDGYVLLSSLPVQLVAGQDDHVTVVIVPVVPPLPPVHTRDQVLNVHLTFQGLTCTTPDHGTLPMFEAAMAWFTPADRQAVYACKHAAGDTHAIIAVPSGRPLYDEPGQPYDATHFPSLDWTGHLTQMDGAFRALVEEELRAGFTPLVFLDEIQATSTATLPLVIDALQHGDDDVDLTQYVIILPGWDSVFYGWEPSQTVIPAWAALGRKTCPQCIFALEFNTGHLPQEGGVSLVDFDALFVEFGGIHDNNTWGILGRLLGEPQFGGTYIKPSDDTPTNNGNDRNPRPWLFSQPSPRGPYQTVCFELGDDEYNWVRSNITRLVIQQHRDYLRAAGCSASG